MLKRNAELDLQIEKVAFGGKGIARHNGMVFFVERTLPGDRVRARIKKRKKNYVEAIPIQILQPSPLRIPAPCKHFGVCGGCKWQNVDYPQQLQFKKQLVAESLQHLGGLRGIEVLDPLPSPRIFHYRNKMEFSFSARRWLPPEELNRPDIKKGFALGLHIPGSFEHIIQIEYCWLQSEEMNQVLQFCTEYFAHSELPVYNLRTQEGLLRFLVLRQSAALGQVMVNVVTREPAQESLLPFARAIAKRFPFVTSVVNGVNPRPAQIAYSDQVFLLHGESFIQEKLGDCLFMISPNSFFQTNSYQAERMYRLVESLASPRDRRIWDLYSGIGSIAIFLGRKARQVIGFELLETAVEDARKNAQLNGLRNCHFVAGDLKDTLGQYIQEPPEVVICDPPRAGLHPSVLNRLLDVAAPEMVYVSCNPTTLARDLARLSTRYRIERVQPVDMFPHTYHIETVVKLSLK